MILVADSGSTKTDWVVIEKNNPDAAVYTTRGMNPNIVGKEELISIIREFSLQLTNAEQVQKIYFFGAGCSSPANAGIISQSLSTVFNEAEIFIDTDLAAAARSVCHPQENAIVGILGTGSNSCLYDDGVISAANFSLGYILGDEGSGSYFGRRLLSDHFYQLLPPELEIAFNNAYNIDRDTVIRKVYKEPFPSEYIASFLPFIHQHIHTDYCQSLLREGFDKYLRIYICRFADYRERTTHFVGSAAWFFRDILQQQAQLSGITIGKIIQSPIHSLAAGFFSAT